MRGERSPTSNELVRRAGLGEIGERGGQADESQNRPHEDAYLSLNCAKAAGRLGWFPLIGLDQSLELTVNWYKAPQQGADMRALSLQQIKTVLSATL
jgi:nucleoside-diphosphate-sugar epimerase